MDDGADGADAHAHAGGGAGTGAAGALHAAAAQGKKTFEMKPWRAAGPSGGRAASSPGGIRYAVDNAGATLVATGFT